MDTGRISLTPKALAALLLTLLTGLIGGGAGGPWLLAQRPTQQATQATQEVQQAARLAAQEATSKIGERVAVVETKVDLILVQMSEVIRNQREQAGKGR